LPEDRRRNKPMLIPVVVGLLERGTGKEVMPSKVLELTTEEQTFTFEGLSAEPVPSLFRDFSAPVKVDYPYSDEDLAFLAAFDTDSFNRWEAAQQLGAKEIKKVYAAAPGSAYQLPAGYADALRRILTDKETSDLSLLSYALVLPAESALMETMTPPINPVHLHEARGAVRKAIATALKDDFTKRYQELSPAAGEPVVIDGVSAGKRRLRNLCLGYLSAFQDADSVALNAAQFKEARARGCMTDKLAAFGNLVEMPDTPESKEAIGAFFEDAKGDALVVNKWFGMQAGADVPDGLARVQRLMEHPDFTLKNPNRLRSVVSVFGGNVANFHKIDGTGYAFMTKMVLEVDKLNPQVASRMALTFSTWAKLDPARQALIKEQLAVLNSKGSELSKDTFEVVSRVSKVA